MAGSLSPRSAGGDDVEELHEINVTPFIDVMLVLLIIFMIAAPLATVDVAVDLPGSSATPQPRPAQPVYLTLKTDLGLVLGDLPVAREALAADLAKATDGDHDARIFLRADEAVGYGELMQVLDLLREAGYLKVALVGLEQAPGPAPAGAQP
jgi:biopolymer transport protein ExbD